MKFFNDYFNNFFDSKFTKFIYSIVLILLSYGNVSIVVESMLMSPILDGYYINMFGLSMLMALYGISIYFVQKYLKEISFFNKFILVLNSIPISVSLIVIVTLSSFFNFDIDKIVKNREKNKIE